MTLDLLQTPAGPPLRAATGSAVVAHQSQLPPHLNKFHKGNGDDGKHYWLTPWDEPAIAQLVADYGPGLSTSIRAHARSLTTSTA